MNIRLALLLGVMVLVVSVAPVGVIIANPGWDYYKDITINGSKVSGTVTSFPVLVSLASDSDLAARAQSDGGDIVFTDQGNTVKYDHEIESYNSGTGALVAWVEVDSLTNGSDKALRMWYGNAAASDQWNITGTWHSNYVMVQHLQESPEDDVGGHLDSTSYGNDGTPKDFQDGGGGSTNAAGKNDGADDFAGDDDYVDLGDPESLTITTTSLTVSAWVKLDTVGVRQAIYGRGEAVYLEVQAAGSARFWVREDDHTLRSTAGDTTLEEGQWYHIVGVYDKSYIRIYVNGAEDNASPTAFSGTVRDYTNDLPNTIGGRNSWHTGNNTYFDYYADGTIDEVWISKVGRSSDWVATCYNNQSDTTIASDKFLKSVGSEQETLGVDPVPEVPTILLLGMGLAGVGVVLVLGRRPRGAPLAA